MEDIYANAEVILRYIVEFSTLLLEFFGICILVFTAVKAFVLWIKKDNSIRLCLAQGIALALEFKLGGEVLRTVVVREWAELGILGAIIALRAILTFLIHWEIKNEKKAISPQPEDDKKGSKKAITPQPEEEKKAAKAD